MIFMGALVFGMGVCYFWPTMIGFVAENLPKTGAVGLNLMGGAGMFAVSVYMIFMGKHYDQLVANRLPAGADLSAYSDAAAGTEFANAWSRQKKQPDRNDQFYADDSDCSHRCICRTERIYAWQKKTRIIWRLLTLVIKSFIHLFSFSIFLFF